MTGERVPVKVMGVYAHPALETGANHFILLRDHRGRRVPIFVGQCEAWGISLALENKPIERPLTYEAMLLCLSAARATIEEVTINAVRDEVFYALLVLRVGDESHEVDLRPSDAVNIALRVKCPLYINEAIVEAAAAREQARVNQEQDVTEEEATE